MTLWIVCWVFSFLWRNIVAHPEGSHLLPRKLNHCCHCLNICYPSSDHSKVLCQSCWKLNFSRRRTYYLTLNSILNLKPSIKLHLADGCIIDSFIYFWTSKSLILVGQMTNVTAFLKLRIGNNYLQLFFTRWNFLHTSFKCGGSPCLCRQGFAASVAT